MNRVIAGVWLAALSSCGPTSGSGAQLCAPANCAGCCDSANRCQPGNVGEQCGSGGAACRACGSGSNDGGTSSGKAPTIASLVANPPKLTPTQTVTLSAVVTDPDNNLAGGTLVDGLGHQLGAFQTPGGQGTFTYLLTWSALTQQAPFDLPSGGGSRTLKATFLDATGNATEASTVIALACDVQASGTCESTCVDLQTSPAHCGQCRAQVPDGGVCEAGKPKCPVNKTVCGTRCVELQTDLEHCGACGKDVQTWATSKNFFKVIELRCAQGQPTALISYFGRLTCAAVCESSASRCTTGGSARYSKSETTFEQWRSLSCTDLPPVDVYSSGAGDYLSFREVRCTCG